MKDARTGSLEEEKEAFVEKISTNPRLSHIVFGRFDFNRSGGHFLQESLGPDRAVSQQLFHYEDIYETAFGRHTGGKEFRARVLGGSVNQLGQLFILSFNDRQGDSRPSSHTDYVLIIPESDVDKMAPLIIEDLTILISVFKKVFPKYDRSGGHLVLDPEHPELIPLSFESLTQA